MTLRRPVSSARLVHSALSGAVISALSLLASPAAAQTATPPATPAPEPLAAGIDASVTVTGNRPTNRIDRQVYDVKSDVASSNAPALPTIPVSP